MFFVGQKRTIFDAFQDLLVTSIAKRQKTRPAHLEVQKASHLCQLPLEIRKIIYSYVLSTDLITKSKLIRPVTPEEANVARKHETRNQQYQHALKIRSERVARAICRPKPITLDLLHNAILATCGQISEEVILYIKDQVVVPIVLKPEMPAIELKVLQVSRRLQLKSSMCADDLRESEAIKILTRRNDIKTLRFRGTLAQLPFVKEVFLIIGKIAVAKKAYVG